MVEPGVVIMAPSVAVSSADSELPPWLSGASLAKPKSSNLACPRLVTKILAGLMSRWMIPLRVRGVEGIGNLDGQIEQGFGIDGTAGDAVLQRLAFEKLHDDESLAVFLVDLVDGADVGMVQCRGGAGFALKTVESLAILGEFFGKKLESDEAAELDVFGAVNDTHAAAAQVSQ